jgi:hypothetical protein
VSSSASFLYSHRTIYHFIMRLLYGRYFGDRYAAIAAEVPARTTVVDICAGDCYLYLKYLRHKPVQYLGLDASPRLVAWANQHGAPARVFDLWHDDLPLAQVVIMQASLYQFTPHEEKTLSALLAAASDKVIISEPIRNLAASDNRLVAWIGHRLTVPAAQAGPYSGRRFDRDSLTAFFHACPAFEGSKLIPGGREMIGIFKGQSSSET